MAKISFGGVVSDARNKLGDVVYSRGRGGAYARAWVIPPNPKTVPQQSNRAVMIAATARWKTTLTRAQRDVWNAYADANPFSHSKVEKGRRSGFGWFVHFNLLAIRYLAATVDAPPASTPVYNPGSIIAFTVDTASLTMNLTLQNPPPPGTAGLFYVSKAISPGITRIYKGTRWIDYFFNGDPNPKNFWATYVAAFPIPLVGQNFGIKIAGLNFTPPTLSQKFYATAIAT